MEKSCDSDKPRILFIMPYFGSWPFWMSFYLKSCSYNSSIDWLFYTDCEPPQDAPSNVSFKSIGYEEYCRMVSDKLDIEFKAGNPYKLCDIRPALGYIHADDLKGYDFWAFGDIDVIYGNLRNYYTNKRLASKDLFSTHARHIAGHLCILRNVPVIVNAYRDIPDWKARFCDTEHHALDEGAFSRLFMGHKNWPDWMRFLAEKLKRRSRRSEFIEAHSTYTLMPDGTKKTPDAWYWDNGRLINTDFGSQELPYLHFYRWKKQDWVGKSPQQLVQYECLYVENKWKISGEGFQAVE